MIYIPFSIMTPIIITDFFIFPENANVTLL